MKKYLLDTNVISELRKARPHGAVLSWYDELRPEQIYVCAATFGELQAGVEKTREQDLQKADELERWIDELSTSSQTLDLDIACLREWGRMKHRKPDQIMEDAMIAATARVHDMVVATRNEGDFKHFDVEILNPFKHPKNA
jgi:toxin FitB